MKFESLIIAFLIGSLGGFFLGYARPWHLLPPKHVSNPLDDKTYRLFFKKGEGDVTWQMPTYEGNEGRTFRVRSKDGTFDASIYYVPRDTTPTPTPTP